jgi:hypothetical protein
VGSAELARAAPQRRARAGMASDDEPAAMVDVEKPASELAVAEKSEEAQEEETAPTKAPSRSRSRSPKRSGSRNRSHSRSRSRSRGRSRGRSRSPRRSSSPRRGGPRERRSLSPASRRLAERRKQREQQERERAREFEQRRRNEQRFDRRRSPPPAMQRARSPPVSHDVAVARLRGEASAKDDAAAAAVAPVERSEVTFCHHTLYDISPSFLPSLPPARSLSHSCVRVPADMPCALEGIPIARAP